MWYSFISDEATKRVWKLVNNRITLNKDFPLSRDKLNWGSSLREMARHRRGREAVATYVRPLVCAPPHLSRKGGDHLEKLGISSYYIDRHDWFIFCLSTSFIQASFFLSPQNFSCLKKTFLDEASSRGERRSNPLNWKIYISQNFVERIH